MKENILWSEDIHSKLAHTYHTSKDEDEKKAILPLLNYVYRQMIVETNSKRKTLQLKNIDELTNNLVADLPLLFKKFIWDHTKTPSKIKVAFKNYLGVVVRCKLGDEKKRRHYEKVTGKKLVVSP